MPGRRDAGASAPDVVNPQRDADQRLGSSATVLSSHYFDAYGQGYNSPSGTSSTPFGYGGQEGYYTDSETGLLLLSTRYYDPARARFVTRDPIGFAGGSNQYGFVGNNPMAGADPSGLCDAPDAFAQEGIDEVAAGHRGFWGGVRATGHVLQTGIEAAAAVSPITSVGIGLNKAGEGKYAEAAGFFLPVVGALGSEGAAAGEAATRATTFYHGTDVNSALGFLNGAGLDAGEAAARAKGGDLGFYLAEEYGSAAFFGSRASYGPGTVLQYEISPGAVSQLQNAGADIRPIPFGGRGGTPTGNEFYIPPGAFDLFNQLRGAGEIRITPYRG